jgi:alpha/beta superfamily hydrolase
MTNFKFYYNKNNISLDIILPGVNGGIDNVFITKISELSFKKGHSSIAINYPFYEREEQASSKNFKEEITNMLEILDYCHYKDYKNIRFIGKSLGGVISAYYLSSLENNEMNKYSITILGYVLGSINLRKFSGDITIVQGELDRFGNIKQVKKDMQNPKSDNITYYEIKGADHSYKNPKTQESEFQDEAISKIKF